MASLTRRSLFLGAAAAAVSARPASASFPSRPVTVIVPYAAGGAGDTIMRILAPVIEQALGRPIVIEARSGGGGAIGAQAVANAPPDGHMLLLGATNNFAINQFMFPRVGFDPLASLALITRVADVPSVLYANVSAPGTLEGFVAAAKARPGALSYASPGTGTAPHLAVERLKQVAGIDLLHVPYRGAPPAMQALIADEVQLYLAGWGVGRAHVEAGRVRALGVAAPQRVPGVPLATAAESGIPGYVASNWWGLAAPRATPQPVLDAIYRAVADALRDRRRVEQIEALGFLPGGEPPAEFLAATTREAALWSETIRRGALSAD